MPLTKEEATRTLQPLIDRAGEGSMVVHDTKDAEPVPPHIKQAMIDGNHPNPRGAYDPNIRTIHIFADGHTSHGAPSIRPSMRWPIKESDLI